MGILHTKPLKCQAFAVSGPRSKLANRHECEAGLRRPRRPPEWTVRYDSNQRSNVLVWDVRNFRTSLPARGARRQTVSARRTGSFDEIAVLVPLPGPYQLDDDLSFAVLVLDIAIGVRHRQGHRGLQSIR